VNSNEAHNTGHLSVSDLRNYLSGSITDAEMHRIEKHLLECDFCAEAMDGYEEYNQPDRFEKEVEELKNRIDKKTTKRIPYWNNKLLKIAAFAALLIVSGVLITNYLTKTAQPEMRVEKKKTEIPKKNKPAEKEKLNQLKPKSDSAFKSTVKSDVGNNKAQTKSGQESTKVNREITKDEVVDIQQNMPEEPITEKKLLVADEKEEIDDDIVEFEVVASENTRPASKRAKVSVSAISGYTLESAPPPSRQISGTLYSPEGESLPFIMITEKNTDNGVISDENGKFTITLSGENPILVFSSVGFNSKEIKVLDIDTLSVTLENQVELNEVVIVTTKKYKRKSASKSIAKTPARPSIGFDAFQRYLSDSLRYPAAATKAKIKGTVQIQFVVKANGELKKIKVLKGLGYGCDEEAIRLLKEGPKWLPGTKNGKITETKTRFDVPFK